MFLKEVVPRLDRFIADPHVPLGIDDAILFDRLGVGCLTRKHALKGIGHVVRGTEMPVGTCRDQAVTGHHRQERNSWSTRTNEGHAVPPRIEKVLRVQGFVANQAAQQCARIPKRRLVRAQLALKQMIAQPDQQAEQLQARHSAGDCVVAYLAVYGHQIGEAPRFTTRGQRCFIHGLGHERQHFRIQGIAVASANSHVAEAFGIVAGFVHGAFQRLDDLGKRLLEVVVDGRQRIHVRCRYRSRIGKGCRAFDVET